jgi:hypothetical protein
MGRSFDTETPVLSYGPRPHARPRARNDRAWLLWPAHAFRVVAPRFEPRRINALQQAVLGVLRASRLTAVELGERLGVNPELAAFVVSELQSQRRVDETWQVTALGVDLLDELREAETSLVPGWVFRDPWSGNLWPFVGSVLEHAPTSRNEQGYPVLELGTTGKPWRQRAWMQLPKARVEAQAPTASEIVRAALASGRRERRAGRQGVWRDDDESLIPESGHVDLRRVSTIDAEPEPVFVTTYLYVPDGDTDWYACDFFGRGSDPSLRRQIFELARTEPNLAKVIDGMLERVLGESFASHRDASALRANRAQRSVERMLTGLPPVVSDAVVVMFEAHLELRDLGDGTGLHRRRSVLLSARILMEQLLRTLAEEWPLAGVANALGEDREVNRALIQGAAIDLGLSEPPDAMCNVSRGQVRSVADFGDSSRIRALVVAHLLRAREHADHWLRRAALRAPKLLEDIEYVARATNPGAHADGREKLESADVLVVVRRCVELVGCVYEQPIRSFEELP